VTAWRDRLAVLRARSEVSAEIYARDNSANSANRHATTTTAEAIGAIGPNVTGIDLAKRAAFLLRAAEDALAALAGPERGPVLQVDQIDHDDAERAALVEHYAEPVAVPPAGPGLIYCFPCGKPVLQRDRTWSEACGWCCATCCPAVAKVVR